MVEVEVGATDRGGRDPHDGVACVQNRGVGHGLDPDVFFPIPAERFHSILRV